MKRGSYSRDSDLIIQGWWRPGDPQCSKAYQEIQMRNQDREAERLSKLVKETWFEHMDI